MWQNEITEKLFSTYNSYFVNDFQTRMFAPEFFNSVADNIIRQAPKIFDLKEIGKSFEGRPIRLIKVGSGDIKILLWSQMHGDESTATMAIADIFNYFAKFSDRQGVQELLSKLSLLFIPLLNPDGAARYQRRTAQCIDINRDAVALVTPEARLLKEIQNEYQPDYGFNLHDQELSTVKGTREISAIAFLAPAMDEEKSDNKVRLRAKKLAAFLTEKMMEIIPGKITRYDDGYEPRAFGDSIQTWGTSTVLIESGHSIGDPEKFFIRKLNTVGLLSAFYAIVSGTYTNADISLYEKLPGNSERAYDLIIRNVLIRYQNGQTTPADLGISYQVDTHTTDTPMLFEVGDLSPLVALREFDGERMLVDEVDLKIESEFNLRKYF
ncbi:MAG: M14 family zinc carboxypeptidase [Bacteroidota bacterium]|nr:M14 family zinc carboxypeptidase [Bacteroidota bacterium]